MLSSNFLKVEVRELKQNFQILEKIIFLKKKFFGQNAAFFSGFSHKG